MKKILLILITITSFSMFVQVAEAKRFGGGKSFGYSKKMAPKQYGQKTPAKNIKPTATGAGATSGASRWLGPLAGIAAGGLLAAMIFGDGFEGLQLFDILLMGLVAFVLFKLFTRRKMQQYAGHQQQDSDDSANEQPYQTRQAHQTNKTSYSSGTGSIIGSAIADDAQQITSLPAWFDEQGFIQNSKEHFVAVQKAWDMADAREIEGYCSPELFNELSAEMAKMQAGDNHTKIDELNVEFVEAVIDGEYLVVSVRFSGYIIEQKGADAHSFNEVWHIRRLEIGEGN